MRSRFQILACIIASALPLSGCGMPAAEQKESGGKAKTSGQSATAHSAEQLLVQPREVKGGIEKRTPLQPKIDFADNASPLSTPNSGGHAKGAGKYEFVRLKHSDRGWNRNLGVGGDYNLLAQLKVREPQAKIADASASIDASKLDAMPAKNALPLLYICGIQQFSLSASEKKLLRSYLIDKHGMILGDNLGGNGFHNDFVTLMNEITGVSVVAIPRDDRIHLRPYEVPQLPIVVAHGGTKALGWKIDGRWAVYYHPGALSDAWRDDHSGVKKEIWESCYQLGINILYYAYSMKSISGTETSSENGKEPPKLPVESKSKKTAPKVNPLDGKDDDLLKDLKR